MWDTSNLTSLGVDEGVNPFELSTEHPAACLRLTDKAVKKWVWDKSVPATTAGFRLHNQAEHLRIEPPNDIQRFQNSNWGAVSAT